VTRGKNKIKYGKVTLDDSYLDPRNQKLRVTTFIDVDVVRWLKKEAEGMGIGYQTLMNSRLRQLMEAHTGNDLSEMLKKLDLPDKFRRDLIDEVVMMMERVRRQLEDEFEERFAKLEAKRA
jgi:hypothetical protein